MSLKPSQPSTSSGAHKRKSSKRLLVDSDEGDDDDNVPSVAQRTKRARTADTDASAATASGDDIEMDADVETFHGSIQALDDSNFYVDDTATYSLSHKRVDASKRKGTTSTKRKFHMVYSDEEESDSHLEHDVMEDDLSDMTPPPDEHSEDSVGLDTPPRRGSSKAKVGPSKGKTGKGKPGQLKGARVKGLKDKDREIHIKDERKLVPPPPSTPSASSITAQSQPSDLFSNEDCAPSATADAVSDATQSTKDPLSQAIPKKRKLPPIRKNKTAGSATGTQTPSTTTQKPAPQPVQELAKPLPTSEQRKQALTGVRDIDLADSKIYAELFKGAGGNTPRSGLKNAEERRKELDRMRDEARARRNEEAKYMFDLQLQADKIARFEQRLRAENSTVLHPNFLAAKFRDEWELDRRNGRDSPKEEGEA